MTTLHRIITAIVMSAVVIIVAGIFSVQDTVYAGGACQAGQYTGCISIAQVGSRTIDPNGNITWSGISEDRYTVIPLSLPPTSGEMTELESLVYDLSELFYSLFT